MKHFSFFFIWSLWTPACVSNLQHVLVLLSPSSRAWQPHKPQAYSSQPSAQELPWLVLCGLWSQPPGLNPAAASLGDLGKAALHLWGRVSLSVKIPWHRNTSTRCSFMQSVGLECHGPRLLGSAESGLPVPVAQGCRAAPTTAVVLKAALLHFSCLLIPVPS